jgi:hypothetical protein
MDSEDPDEYESDQVQRGHMGNPYYQQQQMDEEEPSSDEEYDPRIESKINYVK